MSYQTVYGICCSNFKIIFILFVFICVTLLRAGCSFFYGNLIRSKSHKKKKKKPCPEWLPLTALFLFAIFDWEIVLNYWRLICCVILKGFKFVTSEGKRINVYWNRFRNGDRCYVARSCLGEVGTFVSIFRVLSLIFDFYFPSRWQPAPCRAVGGPGGLSLSGIRDRFNKFVRA